VVIHLPDNNDAKPEFQPKNQANRTVVIPLVVAMILQFAQDALFIRITFRKFWRRYERESGSDSEQLRATAYARHFDALQSNAIRSSVIVMVWQP
jgi:hypothetical protein